MMSMNLKNIVILNIHGVDYCVLLMELAKLIAMCLTNIGRYQISYFLSIPLKPEHIAPLVRIMYLILKWHFLTFSD